MGPKRRCEALTRSRRQCKSEGVAYRVHDNGREYLVCHRHNNTEFIPSPGTGRPVQPDPVEIQPCRTRKAPDTAPRTIGYLRVSTADQDLEKNKADILHLANNHKLGPVEWVEEKVSGTKGWRKRKLGETLGTLKAGDTVIVPELSRLGRSTLQILEIMQVAKERGINVHAIKGGWSLNGSMESKIVLQVLAMVSEIERDLISARTKEALKARKAAGVKLGRPKGPGKSKLDPFRDEIIKKLRLGVPKTRIAQDCNTTPENLHNWIKKNKIAVEVQS